jgi:KUP system potassium uptake protein
MKSDKRVGPLAVAALGVVFGDIGTSPLYTLQTCFTTVHAAPTIENALGIVSLLVWTLVLVVCVKYVTVLMRVDHDGEGGILALLARAEAPKILGVPMRANWLVWVVVLGGAMIIGDGMITPAISVISAIEGLSVATTAAQPLIVPLSAGILLGLFAIQVRGTQKVGAVFGPVMIVWFIAIGATGLIAIVEHPAILAALNPAYAVGFITHHGAFGFLIFGAVILGMTGAEALYADMSHFGRIPITVAWYAFVLPALVLNYVGQGAIIAADPKTLANPFYALTSGWTLLPMVALATAATVIASQSLISGAFTLTEQAIALNLFPRVRVIHTSNEQRGQVYVPLVNVMLAIVCILLVVTFQSSARLAAMFGLAVSATMLATDIVFFVVAMRVLRWNPALVIPFAGGFAALDATFFLANLPKLLDGAWVPLAVAAIISIVAITWLTGRRAVTRSFAAAQQPLEEFLKEHLDAAGSPKGTIVFLTGAPTGVPFVEKHRWLGPLIDQEQVVLLTIAAEPVPYIADAARVTIERVNNRFVRIHATFGYMERPTLEPIIRQCKRERLDLDKDTTSVVYANPVIIPQTGAGGLPRWQRGLFSWLQHNARNLATELEIPANRRVELSVETPV